MRPFIPRPLLLFATLLLVAGAIAFVELRLDATGPAADTRQDPEAPAANARPHSRAPEQEDPTARPPGSKAGQARERAGGGERDRATSDAERIAAKKDEYRPAEEISSPSGFVNAEGFSVREAAGEKVVLVEFWTYTCFNCQNVQPHLNAWHEEYADDGLRVVGVHTPEFGFEKEYANVEAAVREAGIEYPVVLDNAYATWNAYDNRYWPAFYLIDADGFVRYKHFGEGAYGQTEEQIQTLLAEKERLYG